MKLILSAYQVIFLQKSFTVKKLTGLLPVSKTPS